MGTAVCLVMLPIPLLHTISGSLGSWDEILLVALVGRLVIVLVLSILVIGNKGEGQDENE
jgi:hypothetical protein